MTTLADHNRGSEFGNRLDFLALTIRTVCGCKLARYFLTGGYSPSP